MYSNNSCWETPVSRLHVTSTTDTFNVGMSFATGKTASNCWVKNFSVYGDTVDDANATTILDSLTALTVVSPTPAG